MDERDDGESGGLGCGRRVRGTRRSRSRRQPVSGGRPTWKRPVHPERDWAAAVERAERAVVLLPRDPTIAALYLRAAEGSRVVRHRIAALEHLASLVPPNPGILCEFAELHRQVGDAGRARGTLQEASTLLAATRRARRGAAARLRRDRRAARGPSGGPRAHRACSARRRHRDHSRSAFATVVWVASPQRGAVYKSPRSVTGGVTARSR